MICRGRVREVQALYRLRDVGDRPLVEADLLKEVAQAGLGDGADACGPLGERATFNSAEGAAPRGAERQPLGGPLRGPASGELAQGDRGP